MELKLRLPVWSKYLEDIKKRSLYLSFTQSFQHKIWSSEYKPRK